MIANPSDNKGKIPLSGSGTLPYSDHGNIVIVVQAGNPCPPAAKTATQPELLAEDFPKSTTYSLSQNHPNPFNSTMLIEYGLSENTHVRITVYDMLGREISKLVDEYQEAGYRFVQFEASELSSGLFFYRLQAERFNEVKKMIVLK